MLQLIKIIIRRSAMLLLVPYYKYGRGVQLRPSVIITSRTAISRGCVVHRRCNVANSKIGFGTYIGSGSRISDTYIGKFCTIAHNVEVINATHPTERFVSIHPAFYSTLKQSGFTYVTQQKFDEFLYVDKKDRISVRIGNDVWIGANVIIMGGVTIGDGAVVAAGSIVRKDVAPYSIVGGVPAKHLKYRFEEEQVRVLLDIKWWDKPEGWLKENVELFEDIDCFVEKFQR